MGFAYWSLGLQNSANCIKLIKLLRIMKLCDTDYGELDLIFCGPFFLFEKVRSTLSRN
jgi:hypothetical protein